MASVQAQNRARQEAQVRAAERRGNSPAVTNASTPNDFTPARDYFPDLRNQGGYGLPFLGGFGVGGMGVFW